ncbi:hypothetical protein ES705_17053 [subsurface metagenome]
MKAFTSTYPKLSRVLINDVMITKAISLTKSSNIKIEDYNFKKYKAIWDTGATGSVITEKVVEELDLKPTGMVIVSTASGETIANTYIVNIWLPNKVVFDELKVTEGKLQGKNEVLIGMDIISSGDFAVTNYDGKTVFTFRHPSAARIDFVKNIRQEITVKGSKKVGRNDPCPCGSGKKYKHCCLKKMNIHTE